jgi:hypothetical protein
MADLWRDFWMRETGTGQQMAQLHDRYMMMIIIYTLQKLRMQYQSFPDTITNYIFTNNGERSTQPNNVDEI